MALKILTCLGTRPEIIRLSRVIDKLDGICDHILVNTGQNYDNKLNYDFWGELNIRKPNYDLAIKTDSFASQVAEILARIEMIIDLEKPDRFLILGDTNSALTAFVAKRKGIPVYHMEAGNRCFDDRVPEEVNRRIIDHCSDVLMPYTERSRANLLREGIESNRIYVIGNPIYEVMGHYSHEINFDAVASKYKLKQYGYILVTAHREENVDNEERLKKIIASCCALRGKYKIPIIFSRHPRTTRRMKEWGISGELNYYEPFGFLEFLTLEQKALCVITDSGTVQEEACINHVPVVTIRDTTERPETIECGSNILSGVNEDDVLRCVSIALDKHDWIPPKEYLIPNVSDTVVRIVCGF